MTPHPQDTPKRGRPKKQAIATPSPDALDKLETWIDEVLDHQKITRDNGRYIHPLVMQAHIEQLEAVKERIDILRQQQEHP